MATPRAVRQAWSRAQPSGWKVRVIQRAADETDASALAAMDDATAVSAALAGNRAAFDTIVRRHQRQIYQLCYRFAGNHEDASDLAQDVFVRAYRGLPGFKGEAAFATWLYRIGVNVCLNRMGSRTRPAAPIGVMDFPDTRAESADSALLRTERAGEIRSAIARLPRKQRATLILRVYHEMPHDEIASVLGSSVGAVKANFFHALANMRKLLRDRR